MTTTAGSPAPKTPRGNRHHRHTKSGSAINATVPLPQKNAASQPRNVPHHHQIHNPPSRGCFNESTQESQKPGTTNSRKKRGRRNKPKDLAKTSPTRNENSPPGAVSVPATPSRPTPISQSSSPKSPLNTPGKVYAGPVFHHSPAPASLPVPRFFSKSVPAPRAPGLQAMLEEDEAILKPDKAVPENHLERLFRADREEKARQRARAEESSDNESFSDTSNRDVFGMEPMAPTRLVFNSVHNMPRPNPSRSVTEPVFPLEMDGSPKPPTPAKTAPPRENNDRDSAALRQFLFMSPASIEKFSRQPPKATPSRSRSSPNHGAGTPQFHRPTNFNINRSPVSRQRSNYLPHAIQAPSPSPKAFPPISYNPQVRIQESAMDRTPPRQVPRILFGTKTEATPSSCVKDITVMEINLRRMLKLDAHESTLGGGVLI